MMFETQRLLKGDYQQFLHQCGVIRQITYNLVDGVFSLHKIPSPPAFFVYSISASLFFNVRRLRRTRRQRLQMYSDDSFIANGRSSSFTCAFDFPWNRLQNESKDRDSVCVLFFLRFGASLHNNIN